MIAKTATTGQRAEPLPTLAEALQVPLVAAMLDALESIALCETSLERAGFSLPELQDHDANVQIARHVLGLVEEEAG